jgi:hypothetical protein
MTPTCVWSNSMTPCTYNSKLSSRSLVARSNNYKPHEECCRDDNATSISTNAKSKTFLSAHYDVQYLLNLSVQFIHRESSQEKRRTKCWDAVLTSRTCFYLP